MLRIRFSGLAWLAAAAAVALAGCSGTPRQGGFYEHDGPPDEIRAVDASDPVPRADPPARGANRPYTVMGRRYQPMTGDQRLVQEGVASWYGRQFHGRTPANGEIYDMYAMSAAHPTMELPSYARVTNLENGRTAVVRVNDRGPFLGGRVIDLSYAAATKLGYRAKGTARVRIERITRREILSQGKGAPTRKVVLPAVQSQPAPREEAVRGGWSCQIGSFRYKEGARAVAAHAQAVLGEQGLKHPVFIRAAGNAYAVRVGSGLTPEQARDLKPEIKDILGYESFVTRN